MLARPDPSRATPAKKALIGSTVELIAITTVQPHAAMGIPGCSEPASRPPPVNATAAPVQMSAAKVSGCSRPLSRSALST